MKLYVYIVAVLTYIGTGNMPSKRGRVYCCDVKDCTWKGERTQAFDHFARNHTTAENAPYACMVCLESFGTSGAMQRHATQKRHITKCATSKKPETEHLITREDVPDIMENFTVLSQSKSEEIWLERKVSVAKSIVAAMDKINEEVSDDLLQRALIEVGLVPADDPTEVQLPVEDTRTVLEQKIEQQGQATDRVLYEVVSSEDLQQDQVITVETSSEVAKSVEALLNAEGITTEPTVVYPTMNASSSLDAEGSSRQHTSTKEAESCEQETIVEIELHPEPSSLLSSPTHGTETETEDHPSRDCVTAETTAPKQATTYHDEKRRKERHMKENCEPKKKKTKPCSVIVTPLKENNSKKDKQKRKSIEMEDNSDGHEVKDKKFKKTKSEDPVGTVKQLIHETIDGRSSDVVTRSVNELSRNIINSNHCYLNLTQKFDDFLNAYSNQHRGQWQVVNVLKEVRSELTSLNRTNVGLQRSSDVLHKDLINLISETRHLGDRLEVVLLGITSSMRGYRPSKEETGPIVPSTRELEQQIRTEEFNRHLETRRHQPPHFKSPNDASYHSTSYNK